MNKERKEQIIDDYIKSIKHYLNVGLCEGQANGSFGEDLMRHFDIIAECFKETTLLEHDLGIDLITLFKAFTQPIFYKTKNNKIEKIWIEHFVPSMKGEELHTRGKSSKIHTKETNLFISTPYVYGEKHFGCKDYGRTWALTKEELTNE